MKECSELLQSIHDYWRPNRYGLRPYLVRDGKKHPFALICPGGAYGMVCSYVEGMPFAKELNAAGYHAIVAYYRIGKKARYPAPQQDLLRAIRDVFAHADAWNLDPSDWSLWGSSAGGHLAAGIWTESPDVPRPNALILVYPVITMGEGTHARSRENLLGRQPDPALIERLSLERHILKDFPPTYVWNGTADASVDPKNSRMLEAALRAAGVPHVAEQFEGVGHGVGLAKGTTAEPWFAHALAFWRAHSENGAEPVAHIERI